MASMDNMPYDLSVIGAGMVGSAIARHVSELKPKGYRICLIGPQEQKSRVCVQGNEIFGAHYDEGRITGSMSTKAVWAELADRSMKRYRDIEAKSGIQFYNPSGFLIGGRESFLNSVHRYEGSHALQSSETNQRFPFISLSSSESSLFDQTGGSINPRKLVDAEIIIASQNGCDVIRDVVATVAEVSSQNGGMCMKIVTDSGRVFWSKKVVLATNAFTTSRRLLPDYCLPMFQASPQTVVLAELDDADTERLRTCPSMVYKGPGGDGWANVYPLNKNKDVGFYLVPPVKYPNGKVYIKIGHSDDILKGYLKHEHISRWHCSGGDPWLVGALTQLLKVMFPGTNFKSFMSDSCVTMVTASHRPYIDMIHKGLGVAIGGNGHAAKSADEVGRLAACMMLGLDPGPDVDMSLFKYISREKTESKL